MKSCVNFTFAWHKQILTGWNFLSFILQSPSHHKEGWGQKVDWFSFSGKASAWKITWPFCAWISSFCGRPSLLPRRIKSSHRYPTLIKVPAAYFIIYELLQPLRLEMQEQRTVQWIALLLISTWRKTSSLSTTLFPKHGWQWSWEMLCSQNSCLPSL